jgi:MSHA biogenesis protein MshM
MYLNHFGLDEPPFRITPHTDFFFAGANRGPTLEALLYAITHDEGIVKVSGEVGSGKTMLCRVLMERLPEQVQTILLANPSLSRDEIIFAIGEELDLKAQSERVSVLLLQLQEHLITLYGENRRVVLLIDEAHAMPQETLEQIRLLSNLETSHAKLLQIVLFGQPELDEHLDQPHMRQLKERITHSFRLEPLLRSDIEAYLDFRMRAAGYRGPNVFSAGAVRRIVKASEGLTRRVNILADKSLLAAFADNQHGITGRHVDRAIRDSEFHRPAMSKAKLGVAAGGVAAGLALGLGLHYLLSPSGTAEPLQAATTASIGAPPGQSATATPTNQAAAIVPPATQPTATATSAPAAVKSSAAAAPAVASATPATAAAPKPAAAPSAIAVEPGSPAFVPQPPPAGTLMRERFAATQQWLKSAPDDHYSIQLYTASARDLRVGEEMLARAATKNLALPDFHVYGVKIDDQQYYRLAYGLYPTFAEGNKGIRALPPDYRQFSPYLRSVERMRSQNRQ